MGAPLSRAGLAFAESMRSFTCLPGGEVQARNMITDAEFEAVAVPALMASIDDPPGSAAAGLPTADRLPRARFELVQGAGR